MEWSLNKDRASSGPPAWESWTVDTLRLHKILSRKQELFFTASHVWRTRIHQIKSPVHQNKKEGFF